MLGRGLRGKTLGIVGYGEIGQATAARARAFGMEVVYTQALARATTRAQVELDELLERAHVVSLHCPLTPETRHLIDAERARADARRRLPRQHRPRARRRRGRARRGAARRRDRRRRRSTCSSASRRSIPDLLGLENVVLVPHLGSATVETRTAMAELAAANVIAVLAGDDPLTPVA